MRVISLACTLFLLGCSNDSPPPTPPPPASPWQVTAASLAIPVGIGNGASYFNFPICADPHTCHISYIERPWTTPLTGKTSITLNYSITGTDPVFDAHSNTNNTCEPNIPHALLIIRRAGDNGSGIGAFEFYRWFDMTDEQPLALGDHVMTAPLDPARWVSVFGKMGSDPSTAAGWAGALANVSNIGVGFGGGCFAAHGVAVTSGAARFIINGVGIN